MSELEVSAHLVDGGLQEFPVGHDFLQKLLFLETQGVEAKSLIHALLTDDWGAPPLFVRVVGFGPDGKRVDITIPYK